MVVPHTKLVKGAESHTEEKSYAKYTLNEYAPDLMYKEILNFIDLTKDNPFCLILDDAPSPCSLTSTGKMGKALCEQVWR